MFQPAFALFAALAAATLSAPAMAHPRLVSASPAQNAAVSRPTSLSLTFSESNNLVRHPVVALTVQAYEAFDAQQAAEKSASNTRNENPSKESAQWA